MPIYRVQGPDGHIYEVEAPADASEESIIAFVAENLARAPKPEKGIIPSMRRGAEALASSARTAYGAVTGDPEAAARAGIERGEDIARRMPSQVSLDKLKEVYEKDGLLPAASEAVSQIPHAIAEQLPNIGAMAAGARLGALAGSPFGPVGGVVGGIAGAVAPSFIQQFGGNIERQAEEGKPIETGTAAMAAVPQAGLDVVATAIPLGGRLVSKLTGIPVDKLLGRTAEQTAKLAEERLLKTLAKGTATGALAEIPTEVTQQMIERAQAGLPLADEDALREYGETAYQVGLLAPIGALGRYSERGGARRKVAEEAELKGIEERQEAERQRTEYQASPEYAKEIGEKFDALNTKLEETKAALKGQPKPTSFEEQKARQQQRKEIAELTKQLDELWPEYQTVQERWEQQKAATTAQTQPPAAPAAAATAATPPTTAPTEAVQAPLPGFEPIETVTPMPEPVDYEGQITALENYADTLREQAGQTTNLNAKIEIDRKLKQIQTAIEEGKKLASAQKAAQPKQEPSRDDQIYALVRRMKKAEAEGDTGAQTRIAQALKALGIEDIADIAPLTQKQEPFKLQLKDLEQEPYSEFAARVYKPGAETIESQEQAYLEETRAAEEERISEAERARRLAPEKLALRRMAEKPAPSVGEGQISTEVDRLVDLLSAPKEGQKPTGRVIAGVGRTEGTDADILRGELAYATITKNNQRVQDLKARLQTLEEPEDAFGGGDLESGQAAKKMGVEGRLSSEAIRANYVTRLSNAQLTAYEKLANFVESVRKGNQDVSDARKETYRAVAERLKDAAIGTALNEMDARRLQAGKARLSLDEKVAAVGQLNQTLNELIERGAGIFEKPVIVPARMRGTALLESAKEQRPPKGRRIFNNYTAAANALRAQMRSNIDSLAGIAAPAAKPRPQPTVQKGERDLINRQYGGAYSERALAVQFAEARKRASESDAATLDDIEAKFKNLTPEAQEMALEQVRRVENRLPLEIAPQLNQELTDLRRAGVSETGQQELFTVDSEKGAIRKTHQMFQRLLDSGKVAELRTRIAKERKAAEVSAMEAAKAEKELAAETAKVEAFQKKLAAYAAKPESEKAYAALEKVRSTDSPATKALKAAQAVNDARRKVKQSLRSAIVELENKAAVLKTNITFLNDVFDFRQEMVVAHPYSKKAVINFTQVENDLKKAKAQLKRVQQQIAKANTVYDNAVAEQEKDITGRAILREGEKAQRKVDRAKARYEAAIEKENATRRTLEARQAKTTQENKSAQQRVEEGLAEAGATVGDRTVVYRNTADPDVQAKVKAKRGAIGKFEAAFLEAQLARDEAGMLTAIKNLEKVYNDVYEILNNAPLVRIRAEDAASIKAQEDFDNAQQESADAMLAQFRELAGKPVFKLKPRDLGPVERTKTGGIKQVPKPVTVAQQEKIAAAAKEMPLEKIAKNRARLKDIDRQLTYIKDNPSSTKEGVARQAAIKRALKTEQQEINNTLKQLAIEQRQVVKEQKDDAREAKATRGEGKRMLREASRFEVAAETGVEADVAPEKEAKYEYEKEDEQRKKTDSNLSTPSIIDTERPTTGLTEAAREMVEDGRVNDIVDELAKNGSTPRIRMMAEKLRGMVMRTKLVVLDRVLDNGTRVAGLYSPTDNTVYLDRGHLSEEDTLHELHHAATDRVLLAEPDTLTATQRAGRTELEGLWRQMKANARFKDVHATKSVREFVAEVRTNEALREKMRNAGKPLTLWERFTNAIKKILKLVNAKQAEAVDYDLERIDSLIESIMLPSNKIVGAKQTPSLLRSPSIIPKDADLASAMQTANGIVYRQKPLIERLRSNLSGTSFATQYVDRFDLLEKLSKVMEPLRGSQMMYFLRMYDQRMNFVSQAVANGVPQFIERTRKDGRKEYLVESQTGANIKNVAKILSKATPLVGTGDNANTLFTFYLAAKRAERVGYDTLNFKASENDIRSAYDKVAANKQLRDIFEAARTEYNAYNKDLIGLLEASGAITKQQANTYRAANDYIPYYRVKNGVAELTIGREMPIKIGNIKDNPQLAELVGGDELIMDFLTSSLQNTSMIMDYALRNKATKNAAYELANINMAKITSKATQGPDVVQFKEHGEDKYAVIDTGSSGIPADLLVKGMGGIPTQLTGVMRLLQWPAIALRKGVTLSPIYALRQLFRDSLSATMLSGANMIPVIDALGQVGSATKNVLESRGITGGQIFTGGSDDLNMILRSVVAGKSTWMKLINKAETVAMEADAVTRRAQYNSYIKQGLSEMEATLMALESMNFNKRGVSPSVHLANSLIPFFNAQIQGLNVLYKAMTGKMPFNERLKIQEKMFERGGMLVVTSLAYAAAMQDDEAYKNATPDQKYGNWFVRIPGMDEPLKIPVPFEVGYIFKSIPEALYNTMVNERGGKEAAEALKNILVNTIPGGSSMVQIGDIPVPLPIPQAMRPAIEVGLGKSFFTGRDILSEREKRLLPEAQFRDTTSELAKGFGEMAGVSPIKLEYAVRGYFGNLPLLAMQAISAPFRASDSPEQAVKRWSTVPVIGQAFQPNDAGYIINSVYDEMEALREVKNTVNEYIRRGEIAKAKELISEQGDKYAMAGMADTFVNEMRNFTKAETAIRASNLSAEEKRAQLDKIRQIKIKYAAMMREVSDRTKPQ